MISLPYILVTKILKVPDDLRQKLRTLWKLLLPGRGKTGGVVGCKHLLSAWIGKKRDIGCHVGECVQPITSRWREIKCQ